MLYSFQKVRVMSMLQYEVAKKLYEEIKEKAAANNDEMIAELYQDFLTAAAEYAKTRLSWSFMNMTAKREDDASRTIKHNGFMTLFSAVCRNLGIDGIDEIMPDRKAKGDFACYIALFMALEQR